ncbi:hypothetical protein K0504_08710 [Neiella marina]|uniref:Lipoprotein n=1 Tax=Neiella holothuriorum TaxID=2870530 RepID=A0ABS7EFL5_9GAMM|nr:hypothetical protein [Neiella holothuriorum]MBW8191113.1 hypothetical protein [Neiella holothuriorum]
MRNLTLYILLFAGVTLSACVTTENPLPNETAKQHDSTYWDNLDAQRQQSNKAQRKNCAYQRAWGDGCNLGDLLSVTIEGQVEYKGKPFDIYPLSVTIAAGDTKTVKVYLVKEGKAKHKSPTIKMKVAYSSANELVLAAKKVKKTKQGAWFNFDKRWLSRRGEQVTFETNNSKSKPKFIAAKASIKALH